MPVVLRSAAHHRRPTDIDVLDRICKLAIGTRNGLREGIQVHHYKVYGFDTALRKGLHVARHIAPREDAPVHLRVQRLDTPVQHFREAGVIGNFGYGEPGFVQQLRGAAGGQELHAVGRESAGEIGKAGLI